MARTSAPSSPTDLSKRSWMGTLKRTVREFKDDNLTDWAAALTYYGILALFPALIALVSIVGLFADPKTITDTLTKLVSSIGPASAVDTFKGPINQITSNRTGAGIALVVGLAGALWSASGYVGAFMRASNAIYEVEEGRPFWKLRPLQIVVTLIMVLLVALVLVALVVTGPLASSVGDAIGVGSTAVTVWNIAKWPVLIGVVLFMFALLYHVSPNVKLPKFRWVSPGSLLAIGAWGVASALFAFYVANFGSYNKTYGALAGVVVFLVWVWITNIAILLGAELNAELERSRELEAGMPGAEHEIQLEPRDAPKDSEDRAGAPGGERERLGDRQMPRRRPA
jgi:membrane protein